MTYGMIVQLPVSVAFGTDDEFDLRVQLEQDLTSALAAASAGICSGGIDTTHLTLQIDGFTDPSRTLGVVKDRLAATGLLGRAEIVLETRSEIDADDCDHQVLWPANHSGKFRVA